MDVAFLDYHATRTDSIVHRAGCGKKIFVAILLLGTVIIGKSMVLISGILLFLYSMILLARLPFKEIFMMSLYPTVFAAIFAYANASGGWETVALIFLRVISTATIMILLFSTTPYPSIFGAINRFLPRTFMVNLVMTYRSIFILMTVLEHLSHGFRLRGGLQARHPVRSLRNIGKGLGYLMLRGLDDGQKVYEVMRLRGFTGKVYHVEAKDR
jgi:cobalt/nickel transport system permease protein